MTWPTKTDFVDGDVLTAAQVNNIGTNLNLFDPTSATAGQVPIANGAGSVAYGTPDAESMTVIASGSLPTGSGQLSLTSIPTTYKKLILWLNDWAPVTNGVTPYLRVNNNSTSNYIRLASFAYSNTFILNGQTTTNWALYDNLGSGYEHQTWFEINQYTETSVHSMIGEHVGTNQSGTKYATKFHGGYFGTAAPITRLDFYTSSGFFASGTYALYGVK